MNLAKFYNRLSAIAEKISYWAWRQEIKHYPPPIQDDRVPTSSEVRRQLIDTITKDNALFKHFKKGTK